MRVHGPTREVFTLCEEIEKESRQALAYARIAQDAAEVGWHHSEEVARHAAELYLFLSTAGRSRLESIVGTPGVRTVPEPPLRAPGAGP